MYPASVSLKDGQDGQLWGKGQKPSSQDEQVEEEERERKYVFALLPSNAIENGIIRFCRTIC